MTHPIVRSAKTIFQQIGPSIAGYNANDQLMLVLPCRKVKSVTTWLASGSDKADLTRLRKSYDELDAETRHELENRTPTSNEAETE